MINLCEYDNSITNSEFKAKVDSLFMMLYISIMTDNLKRVSHLVDVSLLKKYEILLSDLNKKNERQMYDLLTVEKTEILNTSNNNNNLIINIKLTVKYMDYIINKNTKEIVSGNNKERIKKYIYLTLEQTNIDFEENYCLGISTVENFNWKIKDLKTN